MSDTNSEKYSRLRNMITSYARQVKEALLERYPDLFVGAAHLESSTASSHDCGLFFASVSYWRDGWQDSLDVVYRFGFEEKEFSGFAAIAATNGGYSICVAEEKVEGPHNNSVLNSLIENFMVSTMEAVVTAMVEGVKMNQFTLIEDDRDDDVMG